jgi:hypothetical protein
VPIGIKLTQLIFSLLSPLPKTNTNGVLDLGFLGVLAVSTIAGAAGTIGGVEIDVCNF